MHDSPLRDNARISVCMLTYNHAKYVREAIEGVLMQQTDFPIELVIGEDLSTDGTRGICQEYAEKHPSIVRLLPTTQNLGVIPNLVRTLHSCPGSYIAVCEGDDFWTDPRKLQKQVDFLEKNPKFSFCFHDCYNLDQDTGRRSVRIGDKAVDPVVDLKSVLIEKNAPTASLVFRNTVDWDDLPHWFSKISQGDYGLIVLLAEKGLGKYIPDVMSVYRMHPGGVWSGRGSAYFYEQAKNFFDLLFEYFSDPDLRNLIRGRLDFLAYEYDLSQIARGHFHTLMKVLIPPRPAYRDPRLKPDVGKIPGAVISGIRYRMREVFFRRGA